MILRVLCGLVFTIMLPATVVAQASIFVVRHAERADTSGGAPAMMATDPDLSEAGHTRAGALAALLKDADIGAIFVTEFKRTQQTAAPLAKALGIAPLVVPAKDTAGLVARLKKAGTNALVVGHSNTVPDVITALGVSRPVAVADTEYDNLFIVVGAPEPRAIRLRYR
jgi:phosphohistidine phosphatase SixA